MNKGVMLLHGHVHLPKHYRIGQGKSLDVGVDGNDLNPHSLSEVINLLKCQPIKALSLPLDHHAE
jgi:calcineurin-like phosphoesterase family protein